MFNFRNLNRRDVLGRTLAMGAASSLPFADVFAATASLPATTLKILVGAAPGGPSDFLARIYSDVVAHRTAATAVVENKPGAGGIIAAEEFHKRPADETNLMVAGPSSIISPPLLRQPTRYDPTKDFSPVAMLGAGGFVMTVSSAVKADTAEQFIALAKKRDRPFFQGAGGNASSGHLCGAAFAQAAGISFEAITYQGDAKAFTDLLGGQVDVMFTAPNIVAPHLATGAVKVLAVTSMDRLPGFTSIPAVNEAALPGFEYLGWLILFARSGVSEQTLTALEAPWTNGLDDPSVRQKLETLGMLTPGRNRGRPVLSSFLQAERSRTAELIEKLGIKAN